MGFDLVTWSPRVGSSGDDAYNLPGAVKLDATQDEGNPSRIDAGDSSGFSATPTIEQINATTGLNQVVGLLNRRILTYNAAFGTSMTTNSYFSSDIKITATAFSAINTKINTLRTTEGFTSYTFPTAQISSGKIILGAHLAHMRKALGAANLQFIEDQLYTYTWRVDTDPDTEDLHEGHYGHKYGVIASGGLYRIRQLFSFYIPEWITEEIMDTVTVSVSLSYPVNSPIVDLYSSDSHEITPTLSPAFDGSAFRLDNFEDSHTLTEEYIEKSFAVSKTRAAGSAGKSFNFIVCSRDEIEDDMTNRTFYTSNSTYGGIYPTMAITLK